MVREYASHPKSHGHDVRLHFIHSFLYSKLPTRSDLQETFLPLVPHLTHSSPYSASILTLLVATFLGLIPLVPFIPIRPVMLVAGLLPFAVTHPYSLRVLPAVLASFKKPLRAIVARLVDNDNLEQKHWSAPMKEIELWENERLGPSSSSSAIDWSKVHLKAGERKGWTRGRDGWSDLVNSPDGDVRSVPIEEPASSE